MFRQQPANNHQLGECHTLDSLGYNAHCLRDYEQAHDCYHQAWSSAARKVMASSKPRTSSTSLRQAGPYTVARDRGRRDGPTLFP